MLSININLTDRQGNTTTTASRGGLIWILSGDVYNLPPGAELVVSEGDSVETNGVLAETQLTTIHGGVVRLPSDQPGKSTREIEIITASVVLDQATVTAQSTQGRNNYLVTTVGNFNNSKFKIQNSKLFRAILFCFNNYYCNYLANFLILCK